MLRSGEWPARGLVAALASAVFASIVGCGPALTEDRPAAVSNGPAQTVTASSDEPGRTSWETCYSSFTTSGDAEKDLERLVRDCGTTGGMRAVTQVKLGTQTERDPVDRYAFQVPQPDKCYRIYAVGDSSVKDLDLLLRGPSGDAVVADLTHDAWPVLPPSEPVCFSQAGLYMLEVSVYKGAGRYALQVWGR